MTPRLNAYLFHAGIDTAWHRRNARGYRLNGFRSGNDGQHSSSDNSQHRTTQQFFHSGSPEFDWDSLGNPRYLFGWLIEARLSRKKSRIRIPQNLSNSFGIKVYRK
jgi:hypothetical protein